MIVLKEGNTYMKYQNKEEYTDIDLYLAKPYKIDWLKIDYADGNNITLCDLKNSYVWLTINRENMYKSTWLGYPYKSYEEVILSINSSELVCKNIVSNAKISFRLSNDLVKEISISEKFLPFSYIIGNVIFDSMVIENLTSINFDINDTTINFRLKLNKDNIFYNCDLITNPIKFERYSIDGKEKVIANEPNIIYLIKENGRYVKGVAKCDKQDTFDVEKGIKIAKLRAEIKLKEVELKTLTI